MKLIKFLEIRILHLIQKKITMSLKKTVVAFNINYIQYENIGDKHKTLTINEYLDRIRPYLSEVINDHKAQGKCKIQLIIAINFMSSKDSNETRTMPTKSDNIEIMIGNETDEIIEELFESLLQRYEEGLEESMKGSEFIFDSVDVVLYYNLNKISLYRGGSYIDSPNWLKNKKSTINQKNNDNRCFQYAVTAVLNHEQIKKNLQRRSKIKPFIDQYNRKEIVSIT